MKIRSLLTAAVATLAIPTIMHSMSASASERITCRYETAAPTDVTTAQTVRELVCDIELRREADIESVDLTVGDTVVDSGQLTIFGTDGETSAYLFLIDRSNPARSATVARNLAFARDIYQRASAQQNVGIATFASDVDVLLGIEERDSGIDAAIASVDADGDATEFYTSAIEGIRLLASVDADRKALIIMSDGKAEDTAYSMADLTKAAADADVIVYGMGFAERSTDRPDLQVLRRAAEETGGQFTASIAGENIDPAFTAAFFQYLENGGVLRAPVEGLFGDVAVKLALGLADGTNVVHEQNVSLGEAPVEPAPEPVLETVVERGFIGNIYATFDNFLPGAADWAERNTALAALLLLLPLVLIAIAAFALLAGRSKQDEDAAPEDDIIAIDEDDDALGTTVLPVAEDDGVLGWFVMVENQKERFAITKRSLEIGRHSECDFRLNNDSVHRRHAHFQYDPDMNPVIVDLETANGMMVNGEKTSRHTLQDNDEIQLGEVRFRYVATDR